MISSGVGACDRVDRDRAHVTSLTRGLKICWLMMFSHFSF